MAIEGVVIKKIDKFSDTRGWLAECFRQDEIAKEIHPAMSYIAVTSPGMARGPHEHLIQTDYFCFAGLSTLKLYLWDNRKDSSTYRKRMEILFEKDTPGIAIIPPGVVHACKNIGEKEGLVINYPNKLYAGWGRKEKVDEVRHEDNPDSPFKLET